ncbi:MAG: hypothetical protein N3F04_00855 [Candidatus Nezhaarchaeota archaeon]|nr:hypothetical protein [Candidatus Nezhaarchaeota archaeon]MCX8141325.1 hypothetical protein [Candidatus Nezhaarchaeota archaeon]MDW8049591.1 hypothetical protein [Nitrososphaerota archaeon]
MSELSNKLFEVSENVRHVVVTDKEGSIIHIASKAKKEWPRENIKQIMYFAAQIFSEALEAVKDVSGQVESVLFTFSNMKLIVVRDRAGRYLAISMRRRATHEEVDKVINVASSFT